MIRKYRPDHVLHELLSRNPLDDSIYNAVAKTGSNLVDCDLKLQPLHGILPTEEVRRLLSEGQLDELGNRFNSVDNYFQENREAREQEMGSRVIEYAGCRKTNNPIIAILGKNHTRNGSAVYGVLKETGIRYRVIRQH